MCPQTVKKKKNFYCPERFVLNMAVLIWKLVFFNDNADFFGVTAMIMIRKKQIQVVA